MLNGNDVQLFYRLLDSLSTSLRELAVKYELLVAASTRQASDRERTDTAVVAMTKELSTSFSAIAKEFDSLKTMAAASKDSDVKLAAAVELVAKSLDAADKRIATVAKAAEESAVVAREGKDVTVHVDGHMDGFGIQISSLVTSATDIKKMVAAVDEMKKQIEPFKKLATLFSKPAAILVGAYVIFTTVLAVVEGCDQYAKLRHKDDRPPAATAHATAGVPATTK